MQLSIRNQFPGTVVSVASGDAMSAVKVRLSGGQEVTSAITAEAARDLGLAEGTAVRALVKSTEVAVATGEVDDVSIRNRVPGVVASVQHGSVMSTVKITLRSGEVLTAAITRDAAEDLKLSAGASVTALVKSTEVSLAVD
ncbi:TOBE domain-containing protein [Actinoplanes sp. TBRC 11911]|uniref:TOBE domain-containing protein n=1 Tax=Actinoplanes sp. TBRC 11911 TaxID=2729386 RepID=UPI00145F1A78|nr:TOBE domain-containing protein [Actinoplanes sp. TBRC 11911]NMO56233.1 TOBE domain-containing protein [Actinoplanes sp. TBRC 11911]